MERGTIWSQIGTRSSHCLKRPRRHSGVYSALPHQWFSVTRTVSSCVWSYVTSSVKGVLVFAAFPAFPMSFHGHYKTSRPAPSSGSMNLQHVQQGPTAISNLKASQNRANFSTITTAQCSEHCAFKSLTHQGEDLPKVFLIMALMRNAHSFRTWPHPRLGQSSTRSPDQRNEVHTQNNIYIIHNNTVPYRL